MVGPACGRVCLCWAVSVCSKSVQLSTVGADSPMLCLQMKAGTASQHLLHSGPVAASTCTCQVCQVLEMPAVGACLSWIAFVGREHTHPASLRRTHLMLYCRLQLLGINAACQWPL